MRVPNAHESKQLKRLHDRQVILAVEAAKATTCKGVLCSESGAISLSALVGYGNVYIHPRHYGAWVNRTLELNPCFDGHLFPRPLALDTKCIRCTVTYRDNPIEGYYTNE